jgi:predicted  nucleic acid-binding Zn-ribbon protein
MRINDLKEEEDRLNKRFDVLERQLRRAEDDNDDMEHEAKKLRAELRELKDDISDLPAAAVLRRVRDLREDLYDMQRDSDDRLQPIRDEVSKYREELAARVITCVK